MRLKRGIRVATVILSLAGMSGVAWSRVSLDPVGIAVAGDIDNRIEVEMTLSNSADRDIAFSIEFGDPPEENMRRPGPRRDELGEELAQYDLGEGDWLGLAWDGELMWGLKAVVVEQEWRGIMFAFNPEDEEIVERVELAVRYYGMAYDGETFLMGVIDADEGIIHRVDREGDVIERFWVGDYLVRDVASDGWNIWCYSYNIQEPVVVFRQIAPDGEELRSIDCTDLFGYHINLTFTWSAEHMDGHLWVFNGLRRVLHQIHITNDGFDSVQQLQMDEIHYCIEHDGRNLWFANGGDIWYVIDDGIQEWLAADPCSGVIRQEGSETFNLIFAPEEMEEGVYEKEIRIRSFIREDGRDPVELESIEMSAVMSLGLPVVSVMGTVTDAETEEAVEEVQIDNDKYMITRFTNQDGAYAIENLPLGEYVLSYTLDNYLPLDTVIAIEEAGDFDIDISLFHSECVPDVESIEQTLAMDEETDIEFNIDNNGNGTLTYSVERHAMWEAEMPLWELQREYNVGEIVDDNRIEGVVYVDGLFYITGAGLDTTHLVYIIDNEGELVGNFEQFGESNYGMRDLAWDGELLWGVEDRMVYGFTLEGEVRQSFDAGMRSVRGIAWDESQGLLWVCEVTNEIWGYDRDGNQRERLQRFGFRKYGLACYADDPDGYSLYVFHTPGDDRQVVHKIDPETNDTMSVHELEPELGGRPGGAYITDQFDDYNWTFMNIVNAVDDRIDVWRLDSRKDWMQIDPAEGIIEGGDSEQFNLHLSAVDFPGGITYEGELLFLHDGFGGETHLPVALHIRGDPVPPGAFNLRRPADGDTLNRTVVTFAWERSLDPNPEDEVTYQALISLAGRDPSPFSLMDTLFTVDLDTIGGMVDPLEPVQWWVIAISAGDTVECNNQFTFRVIPLLATSDINLTTEFGLWSIYPNPFNNSTRITYHVPMTSSISFQVYDINGREVARLFEGKQISGRHILTWDASGLASGIYIIRMDADKSVFLRKSVYTK